MNKYFNSLEEFKPVEKFPGYFGRFVHNGHSTIAFWEIKANSPIPEHSHLHAQVMYVLEGQFELTVDGITKFLEKGAVVIIPPHIKHGGCSVTDCTVIDVFTPEREDYK